MKLVILLAMLLMNSAMSETNVVRNLGVISPLKKALFLNFPSPAVPTQIPDQKFTPKDWHFRAIGLETVSRCNPSLIVAVIDTGIDYNHPSLKNSIWRNPGENGPWTPPANYVGSCTDKNCNGIDDDGNAFVDDSMGWDFVNEVPLPYDVHGHGTHIAGIIAAVPTDTRITGICPGATIMPLKYYDNSGLGYNNLQNLVRAIQYATKMGAKIINYSGGGADSAPSEREAIKEALSKGILFVSAAGNESHDLSKTPYYPASYPMDNIVSVAAFAQDGQLLPSSNYGQPLPQLAAPGLSVISTLPNGRYGTMSGTSQATAIVSGLAARIGSTMTTFDYVAVKSVLFSKTVPMKQIGIGKVRLDATR